MSEAKKAPEGPVSYHLEALDRDRDGDWEGAHDLIQACSDDLACLIHAYLHRKEGDLGNAGYWYRRAGAQTPAESLDEEWFRLHDLARRHS